MTIRVDVGGRTLRLTNLDKVMFPATGTTKGEILQYYATVAPALVAHACRRPITRIRRPDALSGEAFFEKNLPPGAPDWLPTFTDRHSGTRSGRGEHDITFPLLDGPDAAAALTWMVQQGSVEFHVPQWRVTADGVSAAPDRLVVDLDPGPGVGLPECCVVAGLVRIALEHDGLSGRAVTSGSKGMQIYADIPVGHRAAATDDYVRSIARLLSDAMPELIVWRMDPSIRPGRVFIDWSQNNRAKTTITPWSLRIRERPTVATPVTWDEVAAGIEAQFSLDEALARL